MCTVYIYSGDSVTSPRQVLYAVISAVIICLIVVIIIIISALIRRFVRDLSLDFCPSLWSLDTCQFCNIPLTVNHILVECPNLNTIRQ